MEQLEPLDPQASTEPASPAVPASGPVPRNPRPSFAEMYRDSFGFVWRNLRRLGVAEESIRDAAQDVFLVVHKRIDAFDGTSTVNTWLFAIAMRVASQYRRAARRKAAHIALADPGGGGGALDSAPAPHAGPQDRAETAEKGRLLLQLLDELDDERRAVFIMTELEQMTAPEIADALQLNLNTVYGRLRTARQQFNQALARFQARQAMTKKRRLP